MSAGARSSHHLPKNSLFVRSHSRLFSTASAQISPFPGSADAAAFCTTHTHRSLGRNSRNRERFFSGGESRRSVLAASEGKDSLSLSLSLSLSPFAVLLISCVHTQPTARRRPQYFALWFPSHWLFRSLSSNDRDDANYKEERGGREMGEEERAFEKDAWKRRRVDLSYTHKRTFG